MSNPEYTKELDQLALGLTRSPMFMGVNIKVFFGNVVFCTLLCINAHTLLGVPLFVVLHLILARLSIKEPDYLYIKAKTFFMCPPILNRWFWGTNSYEPW